MRVIFLLIFLTLVVMTKPGFASPQPLRTPSDPLEVQNINESQEIKKGRPLITENQLYFSFNYSAGNYIDPEKYLKASAWQLRYIPYSEDPGGWDYQVGLSDQNWLSLSLGRHWYCCPQDSFKPYARVAGTIYSLASEEFAGFSEFRRWRVHAAVGVGSVFTTEFGAGWAVNGQDLYLQCGFTF